ncbi:MAG TPA: HAD family hydrolase, partial [Thermoanaerobaculia bacterium]
MVRAVTFDITHTLIHIPRLGEIYSQVLGRHGIAVDPERARRLMVQVWQELACSADPARDRFSSHPEGERGWWRRLLERMCEHLGAPPPSPFAAAELFHRFASADAYEIYPEVPGVLAALRKHGVLLGVVSNWDSRLPKVLDELGLARFFDAVTWSGQVGA